MMIVSVSRVSMVSPHEPITMSHPLHHLLGGTIKHYSYVVRNIINILECYSN